MYSFPVFITTFRMKYITKVKGEAIPLQTLAGPEGSRRLRLPDFKTVGT
jgi:hypothetical protein